MTVATNVAEEVFAGDGAQRAFPTQIYVVRAEDIQVFLRTNTDDIEQVLGTNYSISGLEGPITVTMTAAPAQGVTVLVVRRVPYLQTTSIRNQGGFFPDVVEIALDRLTMMVQQLFTLIRRGVRVPPGEALSQLPNAAARANKLLGFDSEGDIDVVIGGDGAPVSLADYLTKREIQRQETIYSPVTQANPNYNPNTPNTCLLYTSPSPRDS